MRILEELNDERRNEIKKEVEDALRTSPIHYRNPDSYSFYADDELTKSYIKILLRAKGYKVAVSNDYRGKYRIQYFKEEFSEKQKIEIENNGHLLADTYEKRPYVIIGTMDKDTLESNEKAVFKAIEKKIREWKVNNYTPINGRYKMLNNEEIEIGQSYLIYNRSLEDMLDIARAGNQESIIYSNDEGKIGFVYVDDGRFEELKKGASQYGTQMNSIKDREHGEEIAVSDNDINKLKEKEKAFSEKEKIMLEYYSVGRKGGLTYHIKFLINLKK